MTTKNAAAGNSFVWIAHRSCAAFQVATAICIVAIGFTGCGPAPTVLSGRVTLDGSPVPEATLQFYPEASRGQTSHAVTDMAGNFSAKVSPVPLVVTITKSVPTGEKVQSFPDSPPVDKFAESLADRYSDRQKTELKVTPIAGRSTVADFALTSKKAD